MKLFFALFSIVVTSASAFSAATAPPETCSPGEHWVRQFHRKSYIRTDGTSVSETDVAAHCQSNPPSFSFWNHRLQNSKLSGTAWPHPNEHQKIWTPGEIERVLEGLADLPQDLWLPSVRGIFRFDKCSTDSLNPGSSRDGILVLYDKAFDKSEKLSRILGHELSHEYYRQLSDKKTSDYLNAADWRQVKDPKTGKQLLIPGRINFVEEDGPESVTEDFSNNLEYFLFDPHKLLELNPKIYEWIKFTMGDKFKVRKGS